jgi:hypothetical protein
VSPLLAAGLFLVTFATLVLEVLDSRLLSVLTWYHLSFFAVSLAMLGMAAGAVQVFLGGARYDGERARGELARASLRFAVSIPLTHVVNLVVPIPTASDLAVMEFVALTIATAVLAVPFYLSGVVVTIALTRTGAQIGALYAWDLLGAAAGCLAVVPLLNGVGLSGAALVAGAAAALGSSALHRYGSVAGVWRPLAIAAGLIVMAGANSAADRGLSVLVAKNRPLVSRDLAVERAEWNSHSFVIFQEPSIGPVFLWGPGAATPEREARLAWVLIDGEAGTPITEWDGDPAALEWVSHDVTTLPYHLRRGHAAVVGVGGGRDVLSALWGGNERVTGIEINSLLLDALTGSHRSFAGIASRPAVRLVHDEARAFLARTDERYDVLQMSLIDTWAATGAGAFSLTENGLYTREAWQLFLSRLAPRGVFSVSRWFNPSNVSETNRLLALGVAALIDRGLSHPAEHLVMAARGPVATLVLSPSPFDERDRRLFESLAEREQLTVLVSPWQRPADARLGAIASADGRETLDAAAADENFDYTPPTDSRPFFFNMLKPARFAHAFGAPQGGVIWGNIRATGTLVLLFVVAATLVALVIFWPLLRHRGLPMQAEVFRASLAYFAAIGAGFMLIQVALLQRFSVLLGHPTYTFALILFSMILFAGLGSMASDRLALGSRHYRLLPLLVAVALTAEVIAMRYILAAAAPLSLPGRTAVMLAFVAPLAAMMGFFFPIGMRLTGQHSGAATAWMWGVNGACGVLASIGAVAISMWVAIDANLLIAAGLYVSLLLPMSVLGRSPAAEPRLTAAPESPRAGR